MAHRDGDVVGARCRDGRLLLDELISGRIELDAINEGYEALNQGTVTRSVIMFDDPT